MGWRWIGIWLVALPLIALAVLWPRMSTGAIGAAQVRDPVTITHYRADYRVDAAGKLEATETITAEFPRYDRRHGIFRYWDITNPNNPGLRQIPTVRSIRMDDRAINYEMLSRESGRFRVAKIGNPNSYLSEGTHVFEINYTIDGVLDPGLAGADLRFASAVDTGAAPAPSVFLWNVVAPGWENEIQRADITVQLPGAVSGMQCAIGWGVGRACTDIAVDGRTVRLGAEGLRPRTPVTVRVGADAAPPPRTEVPWAMGWEPVLGTTGAGALRVGIITVLAALLGAALYAASREKPPSFPLEYGPPDGIGPAQFEMIRNKTVGPHALTATLFHLGSISPNGGWRKSTGWRTGNGRSSASPNPRNSRGLIR